MAPDRRARKRKAMREHIAETAMRLFTERGFDQVTVEEIAEAADVGRKTVFNHFARKEDLFFDRTAEIHKALQAAVQERSLGTTPLEAYRLLAHHLVKARSPYIESLPESVAFMVAVEKSPALQARARALRDELVQVVAQALAHSAGRDPADPDAYLAASLLLATWTAARVHAHQTFTRSHNLKESRAAFLTFIEKGAAGLNAALVGTPFI